MLLCLQRAPIPGLLPSPPLVASANGVLLPFTQRVCVCERERERERQRESARERVRETFVTTKSAAAVHTGEGYIM